MRRWGLRVTLYLQLFVVVVTAVLSLWDRRFLSLPSWFVSLPHWSAAMHIAICVSLLSILVFPTVFAVLLVRSSSSTWELVTLGVLEAAVVAVHYLALLPTFQ